MTPYKLYWILYKQGTRFYYKDLNNNEGKNGKQRDSHTNQLHIVLTPVSTESFFIACDFPVHQFLFFVNLRQGFDILGQLSLFEII